MVPAPSKSFSARSRGNGSRISSVTHTGLRSGFFLGGAGSGHERVAYASARNFFTRSSLVVKPEMAGRLVEWRVDNWILDDNLTHTLSCHVERMDAQALRPEVFTRKLLV